jgi:glycosyltransferase involved in cell wall biosynthesis
VTLSDRLREARQIAVRSGTSRVLNLAMYRALSPLNEWRTRARFADVAATMHWIEHAVRPSDMLISIVMCTRNRADLLPGALASVLAQWHQRWELVVVDDGSIDDTPELLAASHDRRIAVLRTKGIGPAGARNVGLDRARGEAVGFLDDDNRLHPGWLKAVAWALTDLGADSVFGVRVMESRQRVQGCTATVTPGLQFVPYDERRQRYANAVDLGALAHRAGTLRFDETIGRHEDWDYVNRLARRTPPMALPAVSCCYATTSPGRRSADPTVEASLQASSIISVRQRDAARRQ